MERTEGWEKLKDAMHYVAARTATRPGFGAVKLYKVLWFSDARSFVLTGKPITGAEYVREKFGPIPKNALKARGELEAEKRLRIWNDRFGNKPLTRFKALIPPNMNRFSKAELDVLDFWLKHIADEHTAETISEESHDYGWEIARQGERLPLHAFLAERLRDPTPDELAAARGRLGLLGL